MAINLKELKYVKNLFFFFFVIPFKCRAWILDSYPTTYDYGVTVNEIKEYLRVQQKDIEVEHLEHLQVIMSWYSIFR